MTLRRHLVFRWPQTTALFQVTVFVAAILFCFFIFSSLQSNWGNLALLRALSTTRDGAMMYFPNQASPYLQGVAHYRAGNFSEARRHFQKSLATHPDLARNFMLESALAEGDGQKMIEMLDLSRPSERIFLVKVLAEQGDDLPIGIQKQSKDMIKTDPLLASAYLHLLLSKNRFDEVIEFGSTLSENSDSPQIQFMVGRAHFYKKDYANAARIFEEVYNRQPILDNAVWLGKALFNSGRQEEGLHFLETILQQPSGRRYIPYLVDLSVAYANVGRCAEARQILHEATATDRTGDQRVLLESAQRTVTGRCQE
ncbi:tetratricopeptide repeat protein [Caldilinea sp.]|uniref:tetratricopeptide repeat protein n=1 Tax=Caldilinea sp. TaxID=2293560 RepID=UPI00262289F4|nr:tetratricopeptide repeat protein [uncultured Caldilinea sp.]